jgi:hypothetical protein
VADRAGAEMGVAAGVLQHIDPRVTEMHYNTGASVQEAKKFSELLVELTENTGFPSRCYPKSHTFRQPSRRSGDVVSAAVCSTRATVGILGRAKRLNS